MDVGTGDVLVRALLGAGPVNIYLFDVDGTLEISNGPVKLAQVINLRHAGHIVGLCGNWGFFINFCPGWENFLNLIGPIGTSKALYMAQLKMYVRAERYVLVGNSPPDDIEARDAGWEFVHERDFKEGL